MEDRPDAENPGSHAVPLSQRSRREERKKREARREAARGPVGRVLRAIPVVPIAVGLVVLVVVGVVTMWFVRDDEEFVGERDEDPGADGVILADAPPSHWETADCLTDFDPVAEDAGATVVECDQEHNAQVLHTETLEDGPYPGDDEVLRETQAACEAADLVDQDAVDESEHSLEVRMSHPTQSSWGDGDRRVTCTIERADGGDFSGSYVLDPEDAEDEGDDQTEDGDADDAEDDEDTDEPADEPTDEETEDQ
ncbi:septum formation family protein [Nesterenkonia marinintestina]|uniref:septum formation family protein n=1 Tax=Nesterenkonia marinintestina TaxID=2979865 RepID=UPI0021C0D0D4|nr:septum formation family protein [Nesterenkonia sp. GX14115]